MGEGSGVVVSEDGLILTVGHVLGKSKGDLTVVFPDGRRANAKPLGADFARDAGMAKITDPGKWPHVEMGRIEDVKPGQWCIAVGHPGGIQLSRTPPLRLGRILSVPRQELALAFSALRRHGHLRRLRRPAVRPRRQSHRHPLQHRPGRHREPARAHRRLPRQVAGPAGRASKRGEPLGQPRIGGAAFRRPHARRPQIRRLLQQQAQAGDPEALAMVKGGHVMTTPEQMAALIAKWEKKGKPQPAAASDTIDVIKFQRLLQERLMAGDAEVRGLIKDGGLPLSMAADAEAC